MRSSLVTSLYCRYSQTMRIATEFGWLDARVVPGPPQVAVLWHSMFTDSRSWDRVVDDLREKRTLVLVDGWSFGASADLDHVVDHFNDRCVQGAIAVVSQLGDNRDGSLHAAVVEVVHHVVEICAGPEGPPVDQDQGALLAEVVYHAVPAPRIGEHAVPQDGHLGRPRDDPGVEPTEFRGDAHCLTVPAVQRSY